MKKTLLFLFALLMLAGAAFWAYRVNYATQDALARVARLNDQIAREREALSVLRAEWAYLNAPDRLKRLAEEHHDELGLGPLTPDHFETVEKVAYPPHRITVLVDGEEQIVSVLDPKKMGIPEPEPRPATGPLGAEAATDYALPDSSEAPPADAATGDGAPAVATPSGAAPTEAADARGDARGDAGEPVATTAQAEVAQ